MSTGQRNTTKASPTSPTFDPGRGADYGESLALDSDFQHPSLHATPDSLIAHFEAREGRNAAPLRNPHRETKVSEAERRAATPAAVMIPVIDRAAGLTVLLTKRHELISHAGHICFPGGRRDVGDADARANAVRETEEEIGLAADRIRVLGRLGEYVTHSGFRIAPFVGLVKPPLELRPQPGEVEAIVEIPLSVALRSDSYELRGWQNSDRAHYTLRYGEIWVTGPTVSILMGFYETLLESHAGSEGEAS